MARPDYEFDRDTIEEHCRAGLDDTRLTLTEPGVLAPPPPELGVATHDVHRAAAVPVTAERSMA